MAGGAAEFQRGLRRHRFNVGGASDTINIYLFNTAFAYFHMGMASSMVVIFFAIVLGVAILAVRIRRATWI